MKPSQQVIVEGNLVAEGPAGFIRITPSASGPVIDADSFSALLSIPRLRRIPQLAWMDLSAVLIARKGVAFASLRGPLKIGLQWPRRVLPKRTG